jgi:hypothetical protein
MSGIEPNSFNESEADRDPTYKETYERAYQQALKPWYKKKGFIIIASLAVLGVIGALSPKTSGQSTTTQKTVATKQVVATTSPPKVTGIVLTQNGSRLDVIFTDKWASSASDTFSITYKGAVSGAIAQKGNSSGIYTSTISTLKPGTLNVSIVASNSIGSSAPATSSATLKSPAAIKNLELTQNGTGSVTASWDSGGVDKYEIAWSGSAHGKATTADGSFDIPIRSLGNLQVSVRAVSPGFPPSSWVRKSLKLEEPWNAAPDGSSVLEWKYPSSVNCDNSFGSCGTVMVRATTACTGGVYAEVNHLDSSGVVVGYSNDTVSALQAGQMALMHFNFTEDGSSYQLTKLMCEG